MACTGLFETYNNDNSGLKIILFYFHCTIIQGNLRRSFEAKLSHKRIIKRMEIRVQCNLQV